MRKDPDKDKEINVAKCDLLPSLRRSDPGAVRKLKKIVCGYFTIFLPAKTRPLTVSINDFAVPPSNGLWAPKVTIQLSIGSL
jgi:hypothetical protein